MVHNPWAIRMATCEAPWKCHGLVTHGKIIATSPHDVEMMRVFCSAKTAYQMLQCKISVSAHIKVDICLFYVAILWLFCGYFVAIL